MDEMMNPIPICPWCGNKMCEGKIRRQPHHSLCCADRYPTFCWTSWGGKDEEKP